VVSRVRGLCYSHSDEWMGDVEQTVAALSRTRKPGGSVVVAVTHMDQAGCLDA